MINNNKYVLLKVFFLLCFLNCINNDKNHEMLRRENSFVIINDYSSNTIQLDEINKELYNVDNNQNTIYHKLAKTSNSIKTYLDIDASGIYHENNRGLTPLHISCCCGNLNVTKELLNFLIGEKNIDYEERDYLGNTYIHLLCLGYNKFLKEINLSKTENDFKEILKLFYYNNSSIFNLKNYSGKTPLDLIPKNTLLYNQLKKYGGKHSPNIILRLLKYCVSSCRDCNCCRIPLTINIYGPINYIENCNTKKGGTNNIGDISLSGLNLKLKL